MSEAIKSEVNINMDEGTLTIVLPLTGRLAEIISREVERMNGSALARQYGVKFTAVHVVQKALSDLEEADNEEADMVAKGRMITRGDENMPPPGPAPTVPTPTPTPTPPIPTLPISRRRAIPATEEASADLKPPRLLPNGVLHPEEPVPVVQTDGKTMVDYTGVPQGEPGHQVYQTIEAADLNYVPMGRPLDFVPWSGPVPPKCRAAMAYYAALNDGYPPSYGWLPYRVRLVDADNKVGLLLGFWANRLIDQAPNGKKIEPFEDFVLFPLGGSKPGSGKGVAHVLYLEGDLAI